MAVIRVISATGFSSNDLFGAETRTPTSALLPAPPSQEITFSFGAYGHAPVDNLVVSFNSRPDFSVYEGTYSRVTARSGTTALATIDYGEPVPASWSSLNDMFQSPELFQAANPDLPSIMLAGSDDMEGNAGNDFLAGYGGDDLLVGLGGNDTLHGGDANDRLLGGVGFDVLFGGNGNDLLDGGANGDTMRGGSGNDRYILDGDFIIEDAGGGVDTVEASVNHTLFANVENLILQGGATTGTGNTENNQIEGNGANNFLNGLDGNDTLIGNDGEDRLDGGNGADTMLGGAGNDRYIVDSASDVVTEEGGRGLDTVDAYVNHTLAANVENLVLEAAVVAGTGNTERNRIDGNAANNTLSGLSGNDLLFGHAGEDLLDGGLDADTMRGGLGNDRYILDNGGDVVIENGGEGLDTIISFIDHTIEDNVENMNLQSGIFGTGNALANVIDGNSVANVLNGRAGKDVLNGYGGNDTLQGGDDDDRFELKNGTGNDTILDMQGGASAGDVIDIRDFGFASFDAVMAATTDVSGGARIQLDGDDSVFVQNMSKAQFDSNDFVIA